MVVSGSAAWADTAGQRRLDLQANEIPGLSKGRCPRARRSRSWGPLPSRGDPLAAHLGHFGDGEGVTLGVAEGEHGGHAGPAQDFVDVDAGG
jgi:hypothetical protein